MQKAYLNTVDAASFMKGRRPTTDQRIARVRAIFNLLAWIAAVPAALFAYQWVPSYALAIFVFIMVLHVVSRGIADVITDPDKVQRAIFFGLYPLICSAVVYLTYRLWDRMWLAVILGLVLGSVLNALAGAALFPRVYEEEQQDTQERMKRVWR